MKSSYLNDQIAKTQADINLMMPNLLQEREQ